MAVTYLTVEHVTRIHDRAIEKFDGLPGRPPHKLEGVLNMPSSGYGEQDRYTTIAQKAAVYYYYLATGHCFNDGNKRTAFSSLNIFLDLNGCDLIVDPHEAFEYTLKIANHETRPPFEEVVWWVEEHFVVRPDTKTPEPIAIFNLDGVFPYATIGIDHSSPLADYRSAEGYERYRKKQLRQLNKDEED